ncbi:hypothetical protein JCM3765_001650 [Sporobolomyces pararoseus]
MGSYLKVFEPLKELKWTAETQVQVILDLVANREQVFVQHRSWINPVLESKSLKKLEELISIDSTLRATSRRYAEFCQVVKIGTFPMSFSSIALFVVAKCSHQNGHYRTALRQLQSLRVATEEIWERQVDGVEEFEDTGLIEQGLKDFMEERKSVRVKGSPVPSYDFNKKNQFSQDQLSDSGEEESDSDSSEDKSEDYTELYDSRRRFSAGKRKKEDEDFGSDDEFEKENVVQEAIPDLPQPGDRFNSANELFIACYKAMLPTYGNGVILFDEGNEISIKCSHSTGHYSKKNGGCCRWQVGAVVDPSDEKVDVDQGSSYLSHNHNQALQLRNDPQWRPPIKNAMVRAALGLPELSRLKRKKIPSSMSPPSKEIKLQHPSDPFPYPQQSAFTHPRHVYASESFSSTTIDSSTAVSSLSLPSVPISTSPLDIPSHPFRSRLESFLKGLHPSLSPLTPSLLLAGIDTLDTLTLFCVLESTSLVKFFHSVQEKARESNQSISVVNLKLLEKLIREARGKGFEM